MKKKIYKLLKFISSPDNFNNRLTNNINNLFYKNNVIIIYIQLYNNSINIRENISNEIKNIILSFFKDKFKIQINFEIKKKTYFLKEKYNIPGIKKILIIISGKGGVGKSTVCSILSIFLSKKYKVGILDADIFGPSIPTLFKINNKNINYNKKNMFIPININNIKIISLGLLIKNNVILRGPMASKLINTIIYNTYWGKLDYLIIDLPPGTSDIHISILRDIKIHGAIFISIPKKISIIDVKKSINMVLNKYINIPIIGIIENMSFFICEKKKKKYYIFGKKNYIKNFSKKEKINFLGSIPFYKNINLLINNKIKKNKFIKTIIKNILNNIFKNEKKKL
ncbi:MAG: Mrp/NBP35 family ATP-binding protein [Candidatus Shikimatogenerans bostrichidophilus]|nr:MAG: Mrp/NBP35 family ATP-binding protein [Candidatus Shikimatogenerans bostrichidophilus]